MTPLEQAILRTVAYFDLFRYPLTTWEVWKWLYGCSANYTEVAHVLATSPVLQRSLEQQDGFTFLTGHGQNVRTRQERYVLALQKFKIARRAASVMRVLPYVCAVFVCNNLAFSNATAESDIDVLIVIRAGHLWFTRALVTLAVHLHRLRRHHATITNRICLSFYVADSPAGLAFDALRLQPADPYFAYWFASLVPLYDRDGTFAKLVAANPWARAVLPNAQPVVTGVGRVVTPSTFASGIQGFGEWLSPGFIGQSLDRLARFFQLRLIHSRKASKLWAGGTDVVVSDDVLKFHENDRRQRFRQQWEDTVSAIV